LLASASLGSFEGNDTGFFRFVLGQDPVIKAFEESLYDMKEGGIRRIVVPSGALSYPENKTWRKVGPQPGSLSGKNALGFVLVNDGAIDKTLLFDIELLGAWTIIILMQPFAEGRRRNTLSLWGNG
jgi:hypothetical protein